MNQQPPPQLRRREVLQLAGGSMIALAVDCGCAFAAAFADLPLTNAIDAFDHVLFGAADLDAGIRWFEERSSVRAAFGGSHPGRGTRNALVSLGAGHYLEIIAPDPQQGIAGDRLSELRALRSPKIIGWAVGSKDLVAIRSRAGARRSHGLWLRWRRRAAASKSIESANRDVFKPAGFEIRELQSEMSRESP